MQRFVGLVVATAVIGMTCSVLATPAKASGPTPVTQCGTLITQPGSYAVTTNIGPCNNDNWAIDINGPGVSLDLQGHTLTGPGSGSSSGAGYGIVIDQNATDTTVTSSSPGDLISGFRVWGVAVESLAGTTTMTGIVANNNAGGIYATGLAPLVPDEAAFSCHLCVANSNTYEGIIVNGLGVQLTDVTADGNGAGFCAGSAPGTGDGIYILTAAVVVSQSQAENNGCKGIETGNGVAAGSPGIAIKGNTVTGNQYGIYNQADGVTITGNTASGNQYGIYNTASGNATADIFVDNVSTSNTVFDMYDVYDASNNCLSSVWLANTFNSANSSCIR
jgi:parallel beta-helix repeat protein